MGYLVPCIMFVWISGSLWVKGRTSRELKEHGFVPWARGWYWKSTWRLLPESEQKIYGKHRRRQWLLILCVAVIFVLATFVIDLLT